MKDKTVLVIEDNEVNMKLMHAFLEIGKCRILEARDAEKGIRLVKENRPDLVLMGIQLPSIDGLSATRIIKTDPDLENIPIIAVTGNAAPTDGDEIPAIGFADYLFKPFSLETFLETINNHFKKSDL
ncbi:MAG TPA: response regulator [Smithellaceae bacterium]|nr:response regulator [Smithellaceae bacterium]